MKLLIDTKFDGNQAAFARAVGREPAQIWQYLRGYRAMGEKIARHIEVKLRLEPGWLDQPRDCLAEPSPPAYLPARLPKEDAALLDLILSLTPEQRAIVESIARELAKGRA